MATPRRYPTAFALVLSLGGCAPGAIQGTSEPSGQSESLGEGASGVDAFVSVQGDDVWRVEPRVLVINWNPILSSRGGVPITTALGYQDPHALADAFAADMRAATSGAVGYRLAGWVDVNEFPMRESGHTPTEAEWLACLSEPDPAHTPCNSTADYATIIREHDLCGRVERGEIDEVWLFGAPWLGFYESRMAGDGAFWTNAPAVTGVSCSRRFVMMGFSYERGVGEMLHDVGHRLESVMSEAFRGWAARHPTTPDPFGVFAQTDALSPARAMCGDTHHPPNAAIGEEYIYDAARTVSSGCDDFLGWPSAVPGARREVTCSDWGCSHEGYMAWLFNHVPRNAGTAAGEGVAGSPAYQRDWWKYVYAFDTYLPAPSPASTAASSGSGSGSSGTSSGSGSSGSGSSSSGSSSGSSTPAACDTLARSSCDARPECAWFACADRCATRGTTADAVCGPLAECTSFDDIVSCDAHRTRCAWYACANRCYPTGTPLANACPGGASCETAGTIESCSARGATCAWYACANRCYPNGLPLESACGAAASGCEGQRTPSACSALTGCSWYTCSDACFGTGTPRTVACR